MQKHIGRGTDDDEKKKAQEQAAKEAKEKEDKEAKEAEEKEAEEIKKLEKEAAKALAEATAPTKFELSLEAAEAIKKEEERVAAFLAARTALKADQKLCHENLIKTTNQILSLTEAINKVNEILKNEEVTKTIAMLTGTRNAYTKSDENERYKKAEQTSQEAVTSISGILDTLGKTAAEQLKEMKNLKEKKAEEEKQASAPKKSPDDILEENMQVGLLIGMYELLSKVNKKLGEIYTNDVAETANTALALDTSITAGKAQCKAEYDILETYMTQYLGGGPEGEKLNKYGKKTIDVVYYGTKFILYKMLQDDPNDMTGKSRHVFPAKLDYKKAKTSGDDIYILRLKHIFTKMDILDINKIPAEREELEKTEYKDNKMKELLEAALGSVKVFVKLRIIPGKKLPEFVKISGEGVKRTIEVKTSVKKITKVGDDEKWEDNPTTVNYNAYCFTEIIPKSFDPTNADAVKAADAASNLAFYKEIESTLDLVKSGYNVILFGSGYSGSGKSFTLIEDRDGNSVMDLYIKKSKPASLTIYAFEQYGHLDIADTASITDVFEPKSVIFTEKIFVYKRNGDELVAIEYPAEKFTNIQDAVINDDCKLLEVESPEAKGMEIRNVLTDIKIRRVADGRIRATVNNPESSRGHVFYILKLEYKDEKGASMMGYFTIIDMGGQESPPEIMRDYMTGYTKEDILSLLEDKVKYQLIKNTEKLKNDIEDYPEDKFIGRIDEASRDAKSKQTYAGLINKRDSKKRNLSMEGMDRFRTYFKYLYNAYNYYKEHYATEPGGAIRDANAAKIKVINLVKVIKDAFESAQTNYLVNDIDGLTLCQAWFMLTFKFPLVLFQCIDKYLFQLQKSGSEKTILDNTKKEIVAFIKQATDIKYTPDEIKTAKALPNQITLDSNKIPFKEKIRRAAKLGAFSYDREHGQEKLKKLDAISASIGGFLNKINSMYEKEIGYTSGQSFKFLKNDAKDGRVKVRTQKLEGLFKTFLEGFYINDTLMERARYLKAVQMFPITEGELGYKLAYEPDYTPFALMKGGTKMQSLLDDLSKLGATSGVKKATRFIELAAIRGDEGSDDLKYKYSNATCVTLKASAMLSSAQCPVKYMCLSPEEETRIKAEEAAKAKKGNAEFDFHEDNLDPFEYSPFVTGAGRDYPSDELPDHSPFVDYAGEDHLYEGSYEKSPYIQYAALGGAALMPMAAAWAGMPCAPFISVIVVILIVILFIWLVCRSPNRQYNNCDYSRPMICNAY